MAKKNRKRGHKSYALDQFSDKDVKQWEARREELCLYFWEYYAALAYQWSLIAEELKKSLANSRAPVFEFKDWKRVVNYQFSVNPLSTKGSIVDIGGDSISEISIKRNFPSLIACMQQKTMKLLFVKNIRWQEMRKEKGSAQMNWRLLAAIRLRM